MSETLKLEIQTICIVHIIAIILSIIFFMILYMKAKRNYALKAFFVMQLSMIGWMIFKIFKTVSPTLLLRWWFIVGYYACICILEVAFLEFSYAYYKDHPIKKSIRYSLYLFPLIQIIVIITNPYHHLFYATFTFRGDSFAILFYLHTVIVYAFITTGFVYCYKTFQILFTSKNKWHKYLISLTILVPLMINILFTFKVLHKLFKLLSLSVIFDITPIIYTWSTLVFVYATFRYNYLSLPPLMKHEIVHKLDTPICVLDSNYIPIYVNKKLDTLLNHNGLELLKNAINGTVFKTLQTTDSHLQLSDLTFIVYIKTIQSIQKTQYVLTLRNVTPYIQIEAEMENNRQSLVDSNKELEDTIATLKETSKIGARNYIAREMHDIIGHSLVVAIKLLEVSKLYFKRSSSDSILALSDAIMALENGINAMNALYHKSDYSADYNGQTLERELERIFKYIQKSNIQTTVHVKGREYPITEKAFDIVKKICTELVTNTLKHADAKQILINATITDRTIQIIVMDNGKGTDQLVPGNGLIGIQKRLDLIDGHIDYITAKSEGFMSKIIIPR